MVHSCSIMQLISKSLYELFHSLFTILNSISSYGEPAMNDLENLYLLDNSRTYMSELCSYQSVLNVENVELCYLVRFSVVDYRYPSAFECTCSIPVYTLKREKILNLQVILVFCIYRIH